MTSQAGFLKAKQQLQTLLPEEDDLKAKLKSIQSRTRPLRKSIKEYMEKKQINEVRIGNKVFKLKEKDTVSFTKKSFLSSSVISTSKKAEYVKENKSRVVVVSETTSK